MGGCSRRQFVLMPAVCSLCSTACTVYTIRAMRPLDGVFMATACAIVGVVAAGCAGAPKAGPLASLQYSCCAGNLGATVWHPGQQLQVRWTVNGGQAKAGRVVTRVTL